MSLVLALLMIGTYSQPSCPGGTTLPMPGCSNKCNYEVTEGSTWQPSTPLVLNPSDAPIYFSSISCPSDKGKNLEVLIDADEDDLDLCVAPTPTTEEPGMCFGINDANNDKVRCYPLGGGITQSNDGIISDIGEGPWTISLAAQAGITDPVTFTSVKFTCTNKEGMSSTILYIIVACVVIPCCCCLCCVSFRLCWGRVMAEYYPGCVCCCPFFMFPKNTNFGGASAV